MSKDVDKVDEEVRRNIIRSKLQDLLARESGADDPAFKELTDEAESLGVRYVVEGSGKDRRIRVAKEN